MIKKALNKILFVDDDKDILTIAKYSLEGFSSITVDYASSAENAFIVALTSKPDLILLNIMMPEMDGITFFKVMKYFPSLSDIPVIFITAKAQKEEVNNFIKLGAIGVIIKPFDALTLGHTIQKIWDEYQY